MTRRHDLMQPVSALAFAASLWVFLSGDNLTTIIAALIAAGGAVTSAAISHRNGREIRRQRRDRRVVLTREDGKTVVHDEHLPSDAAGAGELPTEEL
jgi:hypothetical protein